jgi:hypothetical protein
MYHCWLQLPTLFLLHPSLYASCWEFSYASLHAFPDEKTFNYILVSHNTSHSSLDAVKRV